MKPYRSVVENIAHHAVVKPNKLCLADEKTSFTYRQAWSKICALSKNFADAGASHGNCIVAECTQKADFLICEMAIQLLGCVFVPIEKNASASRTKEIICDTKAVIHIGKSPLDTGDVKPIFIANDEITTLRYDEITPDPKAFDFPAPEDVAEILFSTGTTGKSKGIVLTHKNDIAIAENVMYGVKMKENNVELIPMPLSHSHGLRRTYANLVNGSSAVFADGVTLLKKVFDLIDTYGVTSMDLSPSMLSIIFKLSKDRLADYAHIMDYIQLGSAPLPEEDKVHLSRLLPNTRLYNFYGSTEAGCSCLLDFNEMSGKPGCIGKPAANAHFIVVDENKKEIHSSKENTGFLASSGAINMKGYFNDPELTAEAMGGGNEYIYTKDLGYIDEDGYIYMLGRKDDVINYGGIKIAPEDIESIAVKHDSVADCACIPVEDKLTGQAPKLFVMPANKDTFDKGELKNYLAKHLDASKQPKYIELIDEIPRAFNGKIKRKDLIAYSVGNK